jgi:hypothetical protein
MGSFQLELGAHGASADPADVPYATGSIHGVTRGPGGAPVTSVKVLLHRDSTVTGDRTVISRSDGAYSVDNLLLGPYQSTANIEKSQLMFAGDIIWFY